MKKFEILQLFLRCPLINRDKNGCKYIDEIKQWRKGVKGKQLERKKKNQSSCFNFLDLYNPEHGSLVAILRRSMSVSGREKKTQTCR